METKHAFILSLLITLALVNLNLSYSLITSKPEIVLITSVVDGDTIIIEDGTVIRLLNINAPEKNVKGYQESKDFLSNYTNRTVRIEYSGNDRYNRKLARIYDPNYINLEIVKRGLGTKFLVQEKETTEFSNAEKQAIKNKLGIWSNSKLNECISLIPHPKEEKIEILQTCNHSSLKNWIITDESRKEYKFPFTSSKHITLYSNEGDDNESALFWGSKTNIWNNDRDTVYLFDQDRNLRAYFTYGYD